MDSLIELCQSNAKKAMEHFLHALSHVPDDRLDWSPTPTSKSAIRIAAHIAVTAGNFAKMINDRRLPMGDEIPPFVARNEAAELALTDKAEIESLLRQNTDAVVAALADLTPEAIELVLDTSLGWMMPMKSLMQLPANHVHWHIGQIDYLQTCWGDQEVHF